MPALTLDISQLEDIVSNASAIRRILRLLPVGGDGSYVAPPTYLDDKKPVHVFETRRIGGKDTPCVLLDSVQSQANRLEDALDDDPDLGLPGVYVDFTSDPDVSDIGTVSSLKAPHRIFDAIIRDSMLDGEPFPTSNVGKQVNSATPQNATALFEYSPSTLVFGGWNSTGDRGGSGRKFQRCIVSEIVGVNVPVNSYTDSRSQKEVVVSRSKRPSSRIDPLEIERVEIYKSKAQRSDWRPNQSDFGDGGGKVEKAKPSDVNHGNIAPSYTDHGVTMDYAMQTTTITLAGLRRLSFPGPSNARSRERDAAGWAVLASLALCAITKQDARGYSLRSRCDLYPESRSNDFEVIQNDGQIDTVQVTPQDAVSLFRDAVKKATDGAQLPWDADPKKLIPQPKLIALIKKSRDKKMQDGKMQDG